jgi:hypothetical protein
MYWCLCQWCVSMLCQSHYLYWGSWILIHNAQFVFWTQLLPLCNCSANLGRKSAVPRHLNCISLSDAIPSIGGYLHPYTRTVWKVRGLTLLLPVGILWRWDDGLFFEVLPLASDAFPATLRPLLENVLQTVDHFEISCFKAPFSWLEKPRNRMGRDLHCMADVLMGFHRSTFSKPNTEFNSDYLYQLRGFISLDKYKIAVSFL